MANLSRLTAAFSAFREVWTTYGNEAIESVYDTYEARTGRYSLFWALYENSVYRDVHKWSKQLRAEYGLYRATRPIYNPAARLGDLWQTMIWGGALDAEAGDGKQIQSAIPIVLEKKARPDLRIPIARIWRDSQMATLKDTIALYGAIMGDVGIKVEDNPERGIVALRVVNPFTIYDIDVDAAGNIKGYRLQEARDDPRVTKSEPFQSVRQVLYVETCRNRNGVITYETFLDDAPYAWNGREYKWVEDYGFVPLVLIKHGDTGGLWGVSELLRSHRRMMELDHIASLVHDQIAKLVNAPFLFAGMKASELKVVVSKRAGQTQEEAEGEILNELVRQRIPSVFGPAGATATQLTSNLQIDSALAAIEKLLERIEADHPLLRVDKLQIQGGLTGRALSLAQQPAESEVMKVRPHYDDALVRAHKMALTIGGMGYATSPELYSEFAGITPESYALGELNHHIEPTRPVFQRTQEDSLERDVLLMNALQAAMSVGAGVDETLGLALALELMRKYGWTDEQIAQVDTFRQALRVVRAMGGQIESIESGELVESGAGQSE